MIWIGTAWPGREVLGAVDRLPEQPQVAARQRPGAGVREVEAVGGHVLPPFGIVHRDCRLIVAKPSSATLEPSPGGPSATISSPAKDEDPLECPSRTIIAEGPTPWATCPQIRAR